VSRHLHRSLACALAASAVAVLAARPAHAQDDGLPSVVLRPGVVITESVRIVPDTYRLPASPSLDSAVVIIRGEGITVDFAGAVMEGTDPAAAPDRATGIAVLVDGGRNIEFRNARIRGYRFAVMVRGTENVRLVDNDVSHSWKPRLYSLVEHESLLDWLSFHHNDDNEWLRFGAGIYLDGVRGGRIERNRAVQGMNGLLVRSSDALEILDNEFAFNSGLGIGMYRSSDNVIMHNRLDYNVRGYSHGYYERGQDSAALLLYEQSMRNVIAYNSATHSGDGLFIWAGQSTMDTGEGGVNDNLIVGNDFSFAPTNGMELTFSRNDVIGNLSIGSRYGLWGGYSWKTRIVGNCFGANQYGVAIEHGQDNLIAYNRFDGDSTAVQLWSRESEPADWGYPLHRDTRSRDHRIERNHFIGNRVGVRGTRTSGVTVVENTFAAVDSGLVFADTAAVTDSGAIHRDGELPVVSDVDACLAALPLAFAALLPEPDAGFGPPRPSELTRRDRSAMIVDEWGPYDWRSPRLRPLDSTRAVPVQLAVLGPPGDWRLVERRGVARVSATAGVVGDTITVMPQTPGDWRVGLEYVGTETVSPRGVVSEAGSPVVFAYERFEPAQQWAARFHAWTDSTHPVRQPDRFAELLTSPPLTALEVPRLDFMWYRPTIGDLPQERVALEATATVTLDPGIYTLQTISDDGVRVWVDDSLVIDHWEPHGSEVDVAPLGGGTRRVRVQHYQDGGWTELRVEILRGRVEGKGSPGPH
jgi:nitrous oxidase accessory protein NosD